MYRPGLTNLCTVFRIMFTILGAKARFTVPESLNVLQVKSLRLKKQYSCSETVVSVMASLDYPLTLSTLGSSLAVFLYKPLT